MTIQPRLDLHSPRIAAHAAGAGLKPEHCAKVMATRPDCGFFEIHPENAMNAGGAHHSPPPAPFRRPCGSGAAKTRLAPRPRVALVTKACPPGAAVLWNACFEGKTLGDAPLLTGESHENFDFGQTWSN
jgi:hypothetical protein